MGVFKASIMEVMQSLRDEIKSVKKTTYEATVDQISPSDPKPGPSKQPDDFLPEHSTEHSTKHLNFGWAHGDRLLWANRSDQNSEKSEHVCSVKAKKHLDKRKHKVQAKYVSSSSSSDISEASVQVKKSSKPKRASSDQDIRWTDPDPVFYREVDMSDCPHNMQRT